MSRISKYLLMIGMAAVISSHGWAQTAAGPQAGGREPVEDHPAGAPAVDTRTDKQKALALQADRLFTMASELKAQVDLTNKNILSLKVVQKAEEIETLAKGMRGQARK